MNKRVEENIKGIRAQIDRLVEGKAELVDNYDWTKNYTLLEFLIPAATACSTVLYTLAETFTSNS